MVSYSLAITMIATIPVFKNMTGNADRRIHQCVLTAPQCQALIGRDKTGWTYLIWGPEKCSLQSCWWSSFISIRLPAFLMDRQGLMMIIRPWQACFPRHYRQRCCRTPHPRWTWLPPPWSWPTLKVWRPSSRTPTSPGRRSTPRKRGPARSRRHRSSFDPAHIPNQAVFSCSVNLKVAALVSDVAGCVLLWEKFFNRAD